LNQLVEAKLFKIIAAGSMTFINAWLGGWDIALKLLVFFMIADYVTGFLLGIKKKQLNSEVMFWGGIRKAAILVVIAIAVLFDELVNNQTPIFRTLAVYYYVAREGISVTENLGGLNVPLPPFVKNVLSQLEEKGGGKAETKTEEEK
jgi:toxin secretion/phage lysis holin